MQTSFTQIISASFLTALPDKIGQFFEKIFCKKAKICKDITNNGPR